MRGKLLMLLIAVLLLAFPLAFSAGCTSEYAKFSGYGFSFEYPKTFEIAEAPLLDPDPDNDSGIVEVRSTTGRYKSFQVIWQRKYIDRDELLETLEDDLDGQFTGVESDSLIDVDRGQMIETTLVGHPLVYQRYTITRQQENAMFGINAVLYCQVNEKWFALKTFGSSFVSDELLLEEFMSYANTFSCH